jgi:charged multivesicular body protein 7
MKTVALLFCVCVFALTAVQGSTDNWDGLRVTFGLDPFSTWDFDSLPRDLSGNMQNFVLKDNQCLVSGSSYLGQRYWYKNDPATILLFDVNGYIAGIQTVVMKSVGWVPPRPLLGSFILEDTDSYSMTVYFVNPSIICTTGRTADDFKNDGTGTGLWLQNGPDPLKNTFVVPALESEMKASYPLWGSGKCFWTMGQHYWYNVTLDMPCNDILPYCLLYNAGNLNAFCFQIDYDVTPSKRYEHPTPAQAGSCCLDPVPSCITGKQSTLHVFLTNDYLANHC